MKKAGVRFLSLFIILAFIIIPLTAKKKPAEVLLKRLDRFINEMMAEWNAPGLAVCVVQDGRLVYSQGFGLRDVEKNLPVTPRTLFAIGSCSNAFTTTAMGILVDEGKLEWDKPLREYLPTFRLKDDFATERMTPRDLVCHRSGLPRYDAMWYNSAATRHELFERLRYLEPSRDFRTTYQYQNLMFMTAGYLVEQITGSSWERFVRNRIFMPLGMSNSNFSVDDRQKAPDFALPYMEKDDKVIEIPFRNIDTVGPAGSINSSVTDMSGWLLLNLSKGKIGDQQIISEASLKEIYSPQMISSQSIRKYESFYSMYGMGWRITSYRGHLMLSHGGGIDGFTARVALLPRDNIGMVIMTNLESCPLPSIIAYNVADRLLGFDQVDWNSRIREEVEEGKKKAEQAKKDKDKDRKPDTEPSHPLEDYAGDYEHPGYGVISVEKKGDGLQAVYNFIPYTVAHYHYDVFDFIFIYEEFDRTFRVSFLTDLKGDIGSLSIQLEPAVGPAVFTRLPEKATMERSFLKKFVGEYTLGKVTATVFIKGENTLSLSVPGQPEYELVPCRDTTFNFKILAGYSIEFIMNESGEVTEAKVSQPFGVFTATKKK